jgi:hypothetical protein
MTGRRRRSARRLAVLARVAIAVVLWSLTMAGPAAADAARPGDVRSEVTGIAPARPGVAARILGGDSFIEVSAAPGLDVVVLGYSGEPYLHIAPDGTVEQNERSPATWLNARRFGDVAVPSAADATAAPSWQRIGGAGRVAWHDHRTHWMAPTRPDPPERAWTVPLLVDGRSVTVEGRYYAVDPPARWPWWLVAAGAGALTAWTARRRIARAAMAVAVPAVLAGAVGWGLARLPGGRNGLAVMALAAVALAATAATALARRSPFAGAFLAGAGVALLVYALRRLDVLGHAVLVTSLPAWLDRLSVALAVGVGAAAVAVGVRHVLRADLGQLGGYQPPGTSASASLGPHEPRG